MAVSINSVPTTDQLPVVVIGAGPIGLAAAAHLIGRGLQPLVLESGPTAGAAVRAWSHVRLFSPWSEVTDPAAEKLLAPTALAPLIDPNVHSCGTVYPHGVNELSHPEQSLYLVGMKSYGRAPTFLAMTGYEQVRSITAALAGDREAAERVELTLPETGVCGGAGLFDDPDAGQGSEGGCCAAPATLQIGIGAQVSSGGC